MKIFLTVLITAVVIVGVLYFVGSQQKTIPVLSQAYGVDSEYTLYVPGGGQSTCTWTYNESGTPQTFTTHPDLQTQQHEFIYNSSISDMAVTCVNSQDAEYTGQFQ